MKRVFVVVSLRTHSMKSRDEIIARLQAGRSRPISARKESPKSNTR